MATKMTVGEQMAEILEDYSEKVKKTKDKVFEDVAKESAAKLRSTSPRRPNHGEYAKSWRMKTNNDGSVVVYNKDHYRLTHLLENGHVIRNLKGTYGRTNGIKHIKPVEEWANGAVVDKITMELEK